MDDHPVPPLPCPGCHAQLVAEQSEAVIRYPCHACGGLMCGIAVFRTVAGQQRGARCWASAVDPANGSTGGRCPFCGLTMRVGPSEHGRVWACRTCEMVWLDKAALASFVGGGGGAVADEGTSHQMRCENCGAPVQHSWDERCEYCGAALEVPTKVVVVDDVTNATAHPTEDLVDRLLGL